MHLRGRVDWRKVASLLPGFAEFENELVGLATNRLIEHGNRVRILRVLQHLALPGEYESCSKRFRLHRFGVDPMQSRSVTGAGARCRGVIQHYVDATRLERIEN